MTHDEARKAAVEAAEDDAAREMLRLFAGCPAGTCTEVGGCKGASCAAASAAAYHTVSAAIAAYERAMADAGWRMARDWGDRDTRANPAVNPNDPMWAKGWNACRAAMMEDEP